LVLQQVAMKSISILVPESSVLQAIADPQYMFTAANQFLAVAGKKPLFDVQLVAARREIHLNNGYYTIHADKTLRQVKKTDLVLIPALFGDMKQAVEQNNELVPWIQDQYKRGAEVASLCVGAFLLGATGLLDGKKCSTHWGFRQEFMQLYPDVTVTEGTIITEEKRVYSSGGATSYWNLLLHLLEKYTDRETAILAAKYFAIDIDRDSQAAFALFRGQKNHGDELVRKVQDYAEQHVEEKLSVDELADRFHTGRRSLERRFRQATGNSVLEYIQRIRIEAAKRSFENSRKHINEVMYDVGYTDTKAFRTAFKKITGLTPVEYRNKYNKMAPVE